MQLSTSDDIPDHFKNIKDVELPKVKSSGSRFALIDISDGLDIYAAFNNARELLSRYLSSVRFQKISVLPIEVSENGMVLDLRSNAVINIETQQTRTGRPLFNADRFYSLEGKTPKNERTFELLDKVLYWYEIAQKSPPEPKLISLWTALVCCP